jgi:nucleoside-diphosphate-sugar epimerase
MSTERNEKARGQGTRTALVLGATGGVGGETASALLRHGWHVKALARDVAKAAARNALTGIEWLQGDAIDRDSVIAAARGVVLLVHAVNPAGYRNWGGLVLPMIDNTIAAARVSDARILLPGTIYNYGPDAFPVLSEESPQHPTTRKGAIRVELERRLKEASRNGTRTIVLRAGDFFGPRPGNNWFSQGLVKPGRVVRSITYPGTPGVGHAWAYLPDVAKAFALLAEREGTLEAFATYHFEGHWDRDGSAMPTAIAQALGRSDLKVKPLPWGLLRLVAPFNETVRELLEMRPLWREPVRLDNRKLVATLGYEPRTPLPEAVAATLHGIGAIAG